MHDHATLPADTDDTATDTAATGETAWPARTAARERNRQALLDAAAELAFDLGYHGTSIDAVAERAGVTKGAVYSIFGSKQQLFYEVLAAELSIPLPDQVSPPGAPLRDALASYGRAWRDLVHGSPRSRGVLRLSLELELIMLGDDQALAAVLEAEGSTVNGIAMSLQQLADAAGDTLPTDAVSFTRTYLAALRGLAQQDALAPDHLPAWAFEALGPSLLHLQPSSQTDERSTSGRRDREPGGRTGAA